MSFRYAIEGIICAIRSEKHLRFHIMIANLICVFAYFFGISIPIFHNGRTYLLYKNIGNYYLPLAKDGV